MEPHGRDPEWEDEYASPPCFMHRTEPRSDQPALPDIGRQWADVKRWRKAERARLVKARLAIGPEDRRRFSESIARELDRLLGDVSGRIVGAYWPFRGEPNLLPWVEGLQARGIVCGLPVVVAPRAPLVFRQWRRRMPMTQGVWNIPVPAEGPSVVPDIVLAPVVGFDGACYRLGNGGGYFDRTLAALERRPYVVGVGFARLRIRTIYPQPHDVPMNAIVTEEGTTKRLATSSGC
ncbi:5-formyltetrahydrofolate cyclo-ligase [Enhydrobacter sp.]|jgi:5,10-methenyltetrahydrofolate synthetase|uniref:5-formyltetrahydrofolate cyclo-ligase n=1 Tax=Enhydrobacter sp. TaxID=1894999 RepID=UPI00263A25F7|nr:5-formyltetrahydrofolate cyclo-ligase [Enhydrobacter sp.]WIM12536.1 MAG: 5-formyltetrahydrofolate cyclo-ligase [Enhydrobacter sp.]